VERFARAVVESDLPDTATPAAESADIALHAFRSRAPRKSHTPHPPARTTNNGAGPAAKAIHALAVRSTMPRE
jgi:hypothetical protein